MACDWRKSASPSADTDRSFVCAGRARISATPPPTNLYLADSNYPVGHMDGTQQDSVAVAWPLDSSLTSDYRLGRLQHAEGAEDKATRRTADGWMRKAQAFDVDFYAASQEYMHEVMWTGDDFSTEAADGIRAQAYDNSWGHGTGATPSLMGFGADADCLVVITDGNPRMNPCCNGATRSPRAGRACPSNRGG